MTRFSRLTSLAASNACYWRVFKRTSVAFLLTAGIAGLAQAQTTLTIAVPSLPQQLNPYRSADATTLRLMQLVTPGLFRLNERFEPVPVLAKKLEQIGPQQWHIHLRKNLFFSDGTTLNAAYLVAHYKQLKTQNGINIQQNIINNINNISKYDEYILNINTTLADQAKLNQWLALPLAKTATTGTLPLGAGRYYITNFTPQQALVLHPVSATTLPTLSFSAVSDPLVRLLKVQRQEVAVAHGDMPPELAQQARRSGLEVISTPSESYTYLGFNCRAGRPGDSMEVRRALRMALDIAALRTTLLGSDAIPAKSLLQAGHPAYWPQPATPFNPEQASHMLQQAGYSADNPLEITLSSSTSPLLLRIAQAVQYQWGQLPEVSVTLKPQEWSSYFANIRQGAYEVMLMTWVGRFDGDIYPLLFHTSQTPPNGLNRGACGNAATDDLLTLWEQKQDPAMLIQVQKNQYEQVWDIPLWRRPHTLVMGKNISNCNMLADGGYTGLLQCSYSK
jgi:ABC-type transport system substrate-binding protein